MSLRRLYQVQTGSAVSNIRPISSPLKSQDILTAAKGGGFSFAGRLFEYSIRFFLSIIVARAIGAEQLGLYTLGTTVVTIVSMMALLGLQTGMVRFLPSAIRKQDEAGIWGIMQVGIGLPAILSVAFAAGLILFSDQIAIQGFHDPRLAPVLALVCLSIPLDTLSFIFYTINQSFKRMEYNVLANNVVLPLVKLFLTVGLLAAGLSTLGVVSAHVIASAVALAGLIYFANSLFPLNRPLHTARRNPGQLLRYSLPTYPGWVINTVRGTFEVLVLGALGLTTGLGIYSAATRFSVIGNMLFYSITGIAAPIISDLHSRGEFTQLKAFYQTTTRWLVMFNLPLFLTFFIFAVPLLSIFGAEFTSGAVSLSILALGTLVFTGTGVGATILDMTDHPKVNSANSVLMVIVTIGLDLILIPRWGIIGAASASAISTVLVNIICLLEVFLLDHMLPYNMSFLKPLGAGSVTAVITYQVNQLLNLSPLLQLCVGATILWSVYILLLIGMGISPEDRIVINRLLSYLKIRNLISRPPTGDDLMD